MRFLIILLAFVFIPSVNAQEIQKVSFPNDIANIPDEIKDLQWNRWTSKNFTVLAIDDNQAKYLNQNLESIKSWSIQRWGLQDFDFSKECKVVVVNNPELFSKMFKMNNTSVEIRDDVSVVFILANGSPSSTIPVPISEICFNEFAARQKTDFNWASYRGMSLLNGSLDQIKRSIIDLKKPLDNNDPIYFSESLFATTKKEYFALDQRKMNLYDQSALVTMLLIRKEYGQTKLHKFLQMSSTSGAEKAIKEVLGFRDYDQFDATLKRYMLDLTSDVQKDVTPNHYLQINTK